MKFEEDKGRYCDQCHTQIDGRSDKRFCSRKCTNQFHNGRRRDDLSPIRPFVKSYLRTYAALHKLYPESGGVNDVSMTKAISEGLDLHSPHNVMKSEKVKGELIRIANYAYVISENKQAIIIHKLKSQ